MKPNILIESLILTVALFMTGCRKSDILTADGTPIKVSVSTVNTKSVAMTTNGILVAGHFVLDAFVTDEYKLYDEEGHETSTQPGGQYISSNGNYNVFYSASSYPDTDRDESDVTEGWYIKDASGYETYDWIKDNLTRFWCRWPAAGELDSDDEGRCVVTLPDKDSEIMNFTYQMPVPVSTKPYTDATRQKDILFAYAEKKYDGGSNLVDIKFNHPLSKVCFCVSPDDGSFDTNLIIKDISISGVPNGGSCGFHGKGQITNGGSNPMFVWSGQSGSSTFRQTYNVSFSGNGVPAGWDDNNRYKSQSDSKDYNVYYAEDDIKKEHPLKKYTCENAFMMIPHTLSGASLKVTFGNTGTGSDIPVSVDLPEDTWYPGYYYCYKISAATIGRTIKVGISLAEWDNYDDKLFF